MNEKNIDEKPIVSQTCPKCKTEPMVRYKELDEQEHEELIWLAYKCQKCGYVAYEPLD